MKAALLGQAPGYVGEGRDDVGEDDVACLDGETLIRDVT